MMVKFNKEFIGQWFIDAVFQISRRECFAAATLVVKIPRLSPAEMPILSRVLAKRAQILDTKRQPEIPMRLRFVDLDPRILM
jgi:hypothetical protein